MILQSQFTLQYLNKTVNVSLLFDSALDALQTRCKTYSDLSVIKITSRTIKINIPKYLNLMKIYQKLPNGEVSPSKFTKK